VQREDEARAIAEATNSRYNDATEFAEGLPATTATRQSAGVPERTYPLYLGKPLGARYPPAVREPPISRADRQLEFGYQSGKSRSGKVDLISQRQSAWTAFQGLSPMASLPSLPDRVQASAVGASGSEHCDGMVK
jgi:hypothetical protein